MRALTLTVSLAFLIGCVDRGPTEPKPVVESCPLGVPGTRIRVLDTPAGVDLLMTTSNAAAAGELRRRIKEQTARHGPDHREGLGHDGRHGSKHGHGLRLWAMPKTATIEVVEESLGARVILVPEDPTQLQELRDAVIHRVAKLEAQGCP